MLVLTRKVNQQIRLGNDITVTILRVKGNMIRIGIDAPRDVRVLRGELEARGTDSDDDGVSPEPQYSDADAQPLQVELELGDLQLEGSSVAAAEGDADDSEAPRQVYQLRSSAPLARFLPPLARESAAAYSL